MRDLLGELAAKAENGNIPGNDAACSCNGCTEEVLVTERVPIGEDGDSFEVEIPLVKCGECGIAMPDARAETLRHAAACRHLGILSPEEVRAVRSSLKMTRKTFSEAFAIPPASMERWENGRLYQNKSSDNLLRALMIPGVAEALDARTKPVQQGNPTDTRFEGNVVELFPALAGKSDGALEDAMNRQALFKMQLSA